LDDAEASVSRKEWLTIAGSAGAGLLLVVLLKLSLPVLKHAPDEVAKGWNREGIKATYMAAQLREVDKTHSALTLSYDLNNLTDLDYRLAESSGVVIMSRLNSGGSLSQEEPVRLSYAVFLPAKQRARLAIEISQTFAWPVQNDARYEEKLKEFVKQRLAGVQGFVLFDEASHSQIDLPAAWPELQDKTMQTGG
jgi:hypothetical protein